MPIVHSQSDTDPAREHQQPGLQLVGSPDVLEEQG
jgi:hypothetical protein